MDGSHANQARPCLIGGAEAGQIRMDGADLDNRRLARRVRFTDEADTCAGLGELRKCRKALSQLKGYPASFALMSVETWAMSARPAAFSFTAAITLPMSRGELAPVLAMAAAISASSSAASSWAGR